jgi:hypothetical protein
MSKINGDKARHAKRARKQNKQRVKNQELRDMFVLPLKTTLTPKAAPKKAAAEAKK